MQGSLGGIRCVTDNMSGSEDVLRDWYTCSRKLASLKYSEPQAPQLDQLPYRTQRRNQQRDTRGELHAAPA